MECGECGVIGECWVTFFIYLVVIIDEIFGVVAAVGVLECAKSDVAISIIVFAAACWRTTDTFTSNIRTRGDVLSAGVAVSGRTDK